MTLREKAAFSAELTALGEESGSDSDSGSDSRRRRSSKKLNLVVAGPGLGNDMLGDYHGTPAVHITFGAETS